MQESFNALKITENENKVVSLVAAEKLHWFVLKWNESERVLNNLIAESPYSKMLCSTIVWKHLFLFAEEEKEDDEWETICDILYFLKCNQ